MPDRLKAKRQTRRDAVDAARLKLQGDPSHINPREDRLLRETMPEAHGRVVTRGLLAEAGRRGDDRVTLLIPEEAALLRSRGGSGTVNPASGLLEYYGDSPGSAGGGGGEGGDNGVGGPGNGSAGTGPGQGPGPGDPGYGGDYGGYSSGVGFGFSNYSAPAGLSYSDISNFGGIGAPGAGSIGRGGDMSNFAGPAGGLTAAGIEAGYAPKDTWMRVLQEYFKPSVRPPGRYSRPTATSPGIFGSFISQITPALSIGPVGVNAFGIGMNIGGAMGRASSPATQAASAAEMSARGSMNSPGNQTDNHALFDNAFAARDAARAALRGALPAGTASGAQTAEQAGAVPGLTTAPGYTVNEAGQVVPAGGGRNTLTGLPTPVENLLSDYIWRGRQGSGFGW